MPAPNAVLRRQYQIFIDRPPQAVFDFFTTLRNYGRITPESQREEYLSDVFTQMGEGLTLKKRIKQGAAWKAMELSIVEWNPPHGFAEQQTSGPWGSFLHRRKFTPFQTGTLFSETLEYTPASGPLGALLEKLSGGAQMDALFAHRHAEAKRLLETVTRIKGPGV